MSTVVEIPVIETERLVLRAIAVEDVEPMAAFGASARSRFVGGPSDDPRDAWWSLATHAGHWILRGYGGLSVRERDGGAVAGRVAIWHPGWLDEPELSWVLYEGFEGRGYAREAAEALRAWAWEAKGIGPLMSLIADDNLRSVALAERLGCVREAEHVYDSGKTVGRWRHPGRAA